MNKNFLLFFLIFFITVVFHSDEKKFDFQSLIGKWEVVNKSKEFKGMISFYIEYDKDRNCLYIRFSDTAKMPLCYDILSDTLRYRIVGMGPTGDLEELRFNKNDLAHYYFYQGKWMEGKVYKKVK